MAAEDNDSKLKAAEIESGPVSVLRAEAGSVVANNADSKMKASTDSILPRSIDFPATTNS